MPEPAPHTPTPHAPTAAGTAASTALGPLEAEVMAVLWQSGEPLAVRQVATRVNADRSTPLAYTTVMTVMSRLAEKGILARSRGMGRGFLYRPVVADSADIAVRGVLAQFGDAALARFVDQVELDPHLRERLHRLIDGER
jgi:predicted transcriptional regulator